MIVKMKFTHEGGRMTGKVIEFEDDTNSILRDPKSDETFVGIQDFLATGAEIISNRMAVALYGKFFYSRRLRFVRLVEAVVLKSIRVWYGESGGRVIVLTGTLEGVGEDETISVVES